MTTTELDRALHKTVLKREAVKEADYRKQREKEDEEWRNNLGLGGNEMTVKELRKIVDSDRRNYYRTLELNDRLYIHYKGWKDLQNLENWTGLKTMYAECNAFSEIKGLQNCTQLRSLFLQENCIKRISGLETLTQLWSLNLSSNFIERIEGLSQCKSLNTLTLAKNKIGFGGVEDLEQLVETNICTLDIQDNKIEDPDVLPEVLARMKDLRVLYLKGNACTKKIVNYRKSLTVYCKELRYIDDRPVFVDDRRAAEAFNRGGIEAERAEKRLMKQEASEAHDRNMRHFNEMIENARKEKRERLAMRQEDKFTDDTDPVESLERRNKRLLDKWKEDNKEDLKDEAEEYAKKCVNSEKLAREGKGNEEKENIDFNTLDGSGDCKEKSVDEACDTGDTASEEGDDKNEKTTEDKTVVPEKIEEREKVDNRKLVYEDIWEDNEKATEDKTVVPEKIEEREKVDNRKLVYEDIWDDVPSSTKTPVPSEPPAVTTGAFNFCPKPRVAVVDGELDEMD